MSCQWFFRVCQNVFLHIFFKDPPKKYLNFTIKQNARDEHAKDDTFRNAFSWTLVIIWSLVTLS